MDIKYRQPSKGKGYIYKYTSPSSKSYIGQTTTSLIIRSGKRGKQYLGSKVFYSAIIKYGFSNLAVEILGEYELNQLDKMEKYWIEKYKTYLPYGYNMTKGGEGSLGKLDPIYAYNLDGTFHKSYRNQNEARKELNINGGDISRNLKGEIKFVKGFIWSKERTESVQPVLTGKHGAKPVLQIDPVTHEVLNIYNSASEAARELGVSRPTGISKCCNGKQKTSAGFMWQFLHSSTTKDS